MIIRTNDIDTSRSSGADFTSSHQRSSCSNSNRVEFTDDPHSEKRVQCQS